MLELIALLIIGTIVSFTVIPSAIAWTKNTESKLKHSLITLAVLFTILNIVYDLTQEIETMYYTKSYKSLVPSWLPSLPTPVHDMKGYAGDNKKWVVLMFVVFFVLVMVFARQ